MPEKKRFEFEKKWREGLEESSIIVEEFDGVKHELSLEAMLDYYVRLIEKQVGLGRVTKVDYGDLVSRINSLKEILAKINDKDVITNDVRKRVKHRIDSLKS
ncbi:MAG: hypothetical protein H6657_15035 [Ardenticatenaceae bacterium]|nr:hypothetical protein [Ardenticatenaceae bacterium]